MSSLTGMVKSGVSTPILPGEPGTGGGIILQKKSICKLMIISSCFNYLSGLFSLMTSTTLENFCSSSTWARLTFPLKAAKIFRLLQH